MEDFAVFGQLVPPALPIYPIPVRRPATLLHAAFRPLVTETPLRFANPSPPSSWIRDFHPQVGKHAWQTKNKKLNEAASEQHKRDVGKLWAARSNGECVFVWVVEKDWATLEIALNSVEV